MHKFTVPTVPFLTSWQRLLRSLALSLQIVSWASRSPSRTCLAFLFVMLVGESAECTLALSHLLCIFVYYAFDCSLSFSALFVAALSCCVEPVCESRIFALIFSSKPTANACSRKSRWSLADPLTVALLLALDCTSFFRLQNRIHRHSFGFGSGAKQIHKTFHSSRAAYEKVCESGGGGGQRGVCEIFLKCVSLQECELQIEKNSKKKKPKTKRYFEIFLAINFAFHEVK